ncbi:hypothetical protein MML48_7g00015223 [Holotrichia oblita]|uniref:Uncharacterized protein n=2 Tax=Holotrichia oblita TaxID=644536 RepID=A0ACB9SVU2_HOLOL|nr:hypothetical protein MML48_7g00015344 [Holotrichia oblita]KAI4458662.1 hypothetical protein MML48_7g00015223 [Holotrichia oblita]
MGCSAAKNLTVEHLDGSKVTELTSQNGDSEPRKVSIPRGVSDIPVIESTEPHTEVLGDETLSNMHETVNGLSFEIPADDDQGGDSIIKKHPPKRFQKLEDQQTHPTLSLVKLQEKLDEAEIRRQQILQQRIQSAKHRNILRKQVSVTSNSAENGVDYLKVPEDAPPAVVNPYDVSYV